MKNYSEKMLLKRGIILVIINIIQKIKPRKNGIFRGITIKEDRRSRK